MPPKKATPVVRSKPAAAEKHVPPAKSATHVKPRPVGQVSKAYKSDELRTVTAQNTVVNARKVPSSQTSEIEMPATSFLDQVLDDDIYMEDYPISLTPSGSDTKAASMKEFLDSGVTSFLDQTEFSDYGSDEPDAVQTADVPFAAPGGSPLHHGASPPPDNTSPPANIASLHPIAVSPPTKAASPPPMDVSPATMSASPHAVNVLPHANDTSDNTSPRLSNVPRTSGTTSQIQGKHTQDQAVQSDNASPFLPDAARTSGTPSQTQGKHTQDQAVQTMPVAEVNSRAVNSLREFVERARLYSGDISQWAENLEGDTNFAVTDWNMKTSE